MPVNVVKTAQEEEAWERAKEIARAEYPDAEGARFYRIVMGIYKKMVHFPTGVHRQTGGKNRR
jgi:hypothetical protein